MSAEEIKNAPSTPHSEDSDSHVGQKEQIPEVELFDRITDDPDIQSMRTEVLKATNRDERVASERDGITPNSQGRIWHGTERRYEMQAVMRFIRTNPEKAEGYGARWNALVAEYPEIGNLPSLSSDGKDVFSWAKEQNVELGMDANDLHLAKDFSQFIEKRNREREEYDRLIEARKNEEGIWEMEGQRTGAVSKAQEDVQALTTLREKMGLSARTDGELGEESSPRSMDQGRELEEKIHLLARKEGSVVSAETGNRFFKESPRTMQDLIVQESEQHTSESRDVVPWTPAEQRELTELRDFFELVSKTAEEKGDSTMLSDVEAYTEHFSYIGEQQFEEAIEGMARVVEQAAAQGKEVYLYSFGKRSEKFVSEKILEKLSGSPFTSRIHLEVSVEKIAQAVAQNPEKTAVFIPDDFVMSGARLGGATETLREKLLESDVEEKQIAAMVTPLAIAGPDKAYENGITGLSYYKSEGFDGHPWPAITGAHVATDYGFGNTVERFGEYLDKNGVAHEVPALTYRERPY